MTVVFPAPLAPSRAVIWSLWKVKVRSRTAARRGSYSLVTDTRVTPRGPPSCFPFPFGSDEPVGKMQIALSGPRNPQEHSRRIARWAAVDPDHETIQNPSSAKSSGGSHDSQAKSRIAKSVPGAVHFVGKQK